MVSTTRLASITKLAAYAYLSCLSQASLRSFSVALMTPSNLQRQVYRIESSASISLSRIWYKKDPFGLTDRTSGMESSEKARPLLLEGEKPHAMPAGIIAEASKAP